MQSRRWHLRVVQSTTCPVREMSSPRVVQSASWQSASWRIRELSSYPLMSEGLRKRQAYSYAGSRQLAGAMHYYGDL